MRIYIEDTAINVTKSQLIPGTNRLALLPSQSKKIFRENGYGVSEFVFKFPETYYYDKEYSTHYIELFDDELKKLTK